MPYLKLSGSGEVITRFVTMTEKEDCTITVQVALDGTEYLTRFGSPVIHYELKVYVNEDGRASLCRAADTLDLLEFSARQGAYAGRISKLSAFKHLVGGWYEATVTLSAQSKVSEQ